MSARRPAPVGSFGTVAPRRGTNARTRRLDEVLAAGKLSTVATGAPCIPPPFDPDFCNRRDPFYAIGVAITSAVIAPIAGMGAQATVRELSNIMSATIRDTCYNPTWQAWFGRMYGPGSLQYTKTLNSAEGAANPTAFCKAMDTTIRMFRSSAGEDLDFKLSPKDRGYNTIEALVYFAEVLLDIVLLPVVTLVTAYHRVTRMEGDSRYGAIGYEDWEFPAIETAFWPTLTAPFAPLTVVTEPKIFALVVGSAMSIRIMMDYMNQIALGVASYLRYHAKLYIEGGMDALAASTRKLPHTYAKDVLEEIKKQRITMTNAEGPTDAAGPPQTPPRA